MLSNRPANKVSSFSIHYVFFFNAVCTQVCNVIKLFFFFCFFSHLCMETLARCLALAHARVSQFNKLLSMWNQNHILYLNLGFYFFLVCYLLIWHICDFLMLSLVYLLCTRRSCAAVEYCWLAVKVACCSAECLAVSSILLIAPV